MTSAADRKLRARWDGGGYLERLLSGRSRLQLAGCAWFILRELPGRLDSRGCCSSCRMEGEAVCCVLLHVASRPLSRTDAFFQLTDGWFGLVLRWFLLSVYMGPAVA